jgi:hypothetical protein
MPVVGFLDSRPSDPDVARGEATAAKSGNDVANASDVVNFLLSADRKKH